MRHLNFTPPSLALTLALTLALSAALARPAVAEPAELGFGQFFKQPFGPRGVEPTPQLLAAQGQVVRLTGFMVQQEQPLPGRFLFAPRPVSMSEHADGDADDLPAQTVMVLLPAAQRERLIAHQSGPITLTGRLDWGPAEDETGRVSWLRLHLAPDALAPTAARTSTPPQH